MLTLVAGIDEVGYGPLLGPLVVSSSIFLIKKNPEIDMWDRLQKSVGKNKRGLGNRLLICDSKKAYNRKAGLGHLERTIKGFLNQLHLKDAFFSSILSVISNDLVRQIEKYPWYPLAYNECIPEIGVSTSNALTKNMEQEGIEFIDFRSICMDVEEFNKVVTSSGNKATTITISVLKLIQQIIAIATFCRAKKIVIYVDRLGGRTYYGDMLSALPDFRIHYREESNTISEYKLISNGKIKENLDIQFEVKSDNKHLPVALASMTGKFIREAVLQNMCAYFAKLQPGLKPTAGYYTDGHRFLKDLKNETLEKADLNREDIVRIK